MNQKLNRLFEEIERQRIQMMSDVRNSPDRFDYKLSDDKWSIHQILAHLITAEKLTNQYISKKIQGVNESGDSGWIEEMKMVVLKVSQRLPFKFKAPALVVKYTPAYSGLDELAADWNKTRDEFRQLLERINDNQLKRKIYKHVFAGRLNIVHAVIFLREHVAHHLPQVNNLLK